MRFQSLPLMKLPIYLDNSATTPVDPRVVAKMLPWLADQFGNPASSSHAFGQAARAAVETARDQVAALINADPGEIVWTSGATESDNLAIKGAALACRDKGKHLITMQTEHKAVLDTMLELERAGFAVTYARPGSKRPARPRKIPSRAAPRHDACFHHARQQRDRRDPGRRRRSAKSAANAACFFTWTPRRPPVRWRSTCRS